MSHVSTRAIFLVLTTVAFASPAGAYTQNSQLERDLSSSNPKALALFPAKGFNDGAAGFFSTHALHVVPNSARAWCTTAPHGVLKPGCYVELYIQGEHIKPRDSLGNPCGGIARWYRASGSQHYVPTRGSFIAAAMASGEWEQIEFAIYENQGAKTSLPGACGRTVDVKTPNR